MKDKFSLHLVEISPALANMQSDRLVAVGNDYSVNDSDVYVKDKQHSHAYMRKATKFGCDVSWYRSLADVPFGRSIFLAHEFLDALPVHKFQVNHFVHHVELFPLLLCVFFLI